MTFRLNLEVRRPDGRSVRVRCVGVPLLPPRSESPASGARSDEIVVPLDSDDVGSADSFRDFLDRVTLMASDGKNIVVVGFEPKARRIPGLLNIEGILPDPVVVRLKQS